MAQIAYTNLITQFTLSTTSLPTIITSGLVIAEIYKEAYGIAYPDQDRYTTDDSNDPKGFFALNSMKAVIRREVEVLCNFMHKTGMEMVNPTITLSNKGISDIQKICSGKRGMVDDVRIYGSDLWETTLW